MPFMCLRFLPAILAFIRVTYATISGANFNVVTGVVHNTTRPVVGVLSVPLKSSGDCVTIFGEWM